MKSMSTPSVNVAKDIQKEDQLKLVFEDQLKDLYTAERLLPTVFIKMQNAAGFPKLRTVLRNMSVILQEQLFRLEEIFTILALRPELQKNKGMDDLIREANSIIDNSQLGTQAKDKALIRITRKMKRYEISMYARLLNASNVLKNKMISDLLENSYDVSIGIDSVLVDIARNDIEC